MKRIFQTIHIWGPCVVSIVTLVYLILFSWRYDARLAYNAGRIDGINEEISRRTQLEASNKSDLQMWQAYTVRLHTIMVEHGMKVPQPPIDSTKTMEQNQKQERNKKEK